MPGATAVTVTVHGVATPAEMVILQDEGLTVAVAPVLLDSIVKGMLATPSGICEGSIENTTVVVAVPA